MATQQYITPILPGDYRREAGRRTWHWDQIYFGPDPKTYDDQTINERFVPDVRDIIQHPDTGDWVVISVSDEYIPFLKPRTIRNTQIEVIDQIVLPSKSYNRRSDVLHVDVTTTPIRFYVNSRIWINGSQASHFKIFMGTNVGANGNSIGAVYNPNGQLIGDAIELEKVAFDRDNITNNAILAPKSGHLRELPLSDDLVTIVVYSNDGTYIDSQVLVVSHDNFIPSSASTKYITDIRIDSPYISDSDDRVIELKRNMLIQSLALFGIVTYNDGTRQRLPINGDKFSLHGMDAFTASTDLHEVDVVLAYNLSMDEAAISTTGTIERSKTVPYTIRTMPSDGAYSVKLFVIPVWNSTTSKWDLRFKLYDLNRSITTDVTDLVEINTAFRFNPDLYQQSQTVQVAINLMNVGPQYKFYRPVQSFNITLLQPGERVSVPAYYLLSYSANLQLGQSIAANKSTTPNGTVLNINCGQLTMANWLSNVYKHLGIIYIGDAPAPPNPTKFRLRKHTSSSYTVHDIADVLKDIKVTGSWTQGETVIVEFFADSAGDTLELGSMSLNVNVIS